MSNSPTASAAPRDDNESPETRHAKEERSVAEASRLSARLIYAVIRRDGEEELERPVVSLFWSGLAAGLLMGLSILAESILSVHLPETPSSFLIENLGYSFGFLVVILGRMQLFTENTITTVLPVVAQRTADCLWRMVRLWAVVLLANVLGALAAAAFMVASGAFGPELSAAIRALSEHAVTMGAGQSFARAIPAGVLVAGIVWMMPSAQGSGFLIILAFTWLIAAGDFTHIIAGSVEMGYLIWLGDLTLSAAMFGYFLPVLAGNIIGGTAIFTLLAWGQVKNEVNHGAE